MSKIIIENYNQTIENNSAINLLNNFRIKSVPIGGECGGRGNCGNCRYKVLAGKEYITPINGNERFRLTPKELEAGWRLSCQSYVIKDLTIYIPASGNQNENVV